MVPGLFGSQPEHEHREAVYTVLTWGSMGIGWALAFSGLALDALARSFGVPLVGKVLQVLAAGIAGGFWALWVTGIVCLIAVNVDTSRWKRAGRPQEWTSPAWVSPGWGRLLVGLPFGAGLATLVIAMALN